MHFFFVINIFFAFFSSFVAYVCYRRGQRNLMWLNIGAVAINVVAVVLGLFHLFTYLTADETDAYDYNSGVVLVQK